MKNTKTFRTGLNEPAWLVAIRRRALLGRINRRGLHGGIPRWPRSNEASARCRWNLDKTARWRRTRNAPHETKLSPGSPRLGNKHIVIVRWAMFVIFENRVQSVVKWMNIQFNTEKLNGSRQMFFLHFWFLLVKFISDY